MSKLLTFIIIFSGLTLANHNTSTPENTLSSLKEEANDILIQTPDDLSVFSSQDIPDDIYERMLGNSIPTQFKDKVDRSSLSYLKISYYGFDGVSHVGEMIVNSKAKNDVLEIFRELYDIKYPIEKIKLIDEYNANDELSMSDNNTSCFCYRVVSNTSTLSKHARGFAIDINPLYNPYVVKRVYISCFWLYLC